GSGCERRAAARRLKEEQLRRGSVIDLLVIDQSIQQEKSMHAGRPLVVPRADQYRLLLFVEFEKRPRVGLVVILEIISGVIVFVLHEEHGSVIGRQLLLEVEI